MENSSVASKKIAKVLMVIFLILGFLFPIMSRSCINFSSGDKKGDMEAKSYDMDVVIDENGDMHVVETIVIDNYVNYYNNYFYKEIAYNKNNDFGNSSINRSKLVPDVKFKVEDASGVVFDSQTSTANYPKHFVGFSYNNDVDERGYKIKCEAATTKYCDSVFYYNRPGFARITSFTYEYTIEGVITQYNDISEFNWVLLGYQPFKFNDVKISITLPEGNYNIAEEDTFFHGTNMAERKFVDKNKIVITADDMISDEQIEVRLLLDNDLFTSVDLVNQVNINAKDDILAFEENTIKEADTKYFWGNLGTLIIYYMGLAIFVLLFFVCYKKHDKEYVSEFYNEYYRELPATYPPAVMGYLYKFRDITDDDLSASLLDLIRRKYLILDTHGNSGGDDERKFDYTIIKNKEKSTSDLTESERFLIKWFIDEMGDHEKVSSLQLKSYCDSYSGATNYQKCSNKWYKLVKAEASKYKFFEDSTGAVKTGYTAISVLIGVALIVIMTLISNYSGYIFGSSLWFGIICLVASFISYLNTINKRSKKGNEDYVRWKAFKKFLEDFSSFEDYPVPSLVVWEHYLVYATSFGIADKVSEQLKLKFSYEEFTSADCTYFVYFGYRHRIGGFNRSIRSIRTVSSGTIARHVTAQRISSRSGGGFGGFRSGGGGFSGGSSRGGGGGSFGGGRR